MKKQEIDEMLDKSQKIEKALAKARKYMQDMQEIMQMFKRVADEVDGPIKWTDITVKPMPEIGDFIVKVDDTIDVISVSHCEARYLYCTRKFEDFNKVTHYVEI